MKFYYVTYATHSERYFDHLIESAAQNSITLDIIGWGEKWVNFRQKSIAVLKYLEDKNDDDVVFVLDGFDSMFIANKEEIEDKYITNFQNKLVFSKNTTCTILIHTYVQNKIFPVKCKNYNISAGLYCGQIRLVRDFWKNYTSGEESDDQIYASNMCNMCDYVMVDFKNILFYNMNRELKNNEYYLNNNRIDIKGIFPCIISAPGSYYIDDEFLAKNNYKVINFNYNIERLLIAYLRFFKEEIITISIILFFITLLLIFLIVTKKL